MSPIQTSHDSRIFYQVVFSSAYLSCVVFGFQQVNNKILHLLNISSKHSSY